MRTGLQNRSQKYPVTGEDFNYGLWHDEKPDRTNLNVGFLRNTRLSKVCPILYMCALCTNKALLDGPLCPLWPPCSSTHRTDCSGAEAQGQDLPHPIDHDCLHRVLRCACESSSSTSPSKPQIDDCFIKVHFSLSSQETFGDGSTAGTFPYEKYYQAIVRYVDEMMPNKDRVELLIWWNV